MSEKSLSKNTRKNVILLHIAVMCFSFSGVIGQYVQVPAVQVAMGRVICSSLLLLAISLVCKDKLTLDSKKDYGLMIMTGVVMAIHWSSFFQSIQTSSVAIGTITFSTFPLSVLSHPFAPSHIKNMQLPYTKSQSLQLLQNPPDASPLSPIPVPEAMQQLLFPVHTDRLYVLCICWQNTGSTMSSLHM